MSTTFPRLREEESVREAVRRMVASRAPAMAITSEDGAFRGVLSWWDVLRLVAEGIDLDGSDVASAAGHEETVDPGTPMDEAAATLRARGGGLLPVVDGAGQLVGVSRTRMLSRTSA